MDDFHVQGANMLRSDGCMPGCVYLFDGNSTSKCLPHFTSNMATRYGHGPGLLDTVAVAESSPIQLARGKNVQEPLLVDHDSEIQ